MKQNDDFDGWGFQYKSSMRILGWPLLHISFKYDENKVPVPAKGIFAIGQFGIGIVNISQFGIGIFSISQFTIAGYALAQFAIANSLIAQFGIYYEQGTGQMIISMADLLSRI